MKFLKNIKTEYLEIKKLFKDSFTAPVQISLIVALFFSSIVIYLTYYFTKNYYSGTFLEGILIEAHGMLFDLWIIGVLILFFHEIERRFNENQKYMYEIDDFRYWASEEAGYRIVGNIKRLNRNNITNIDLNSCFLYLAKLRKVNLQVANLQGANLVGADIKEVNLQGVNFREANLKGVKNLTIEQISKVKTLYLAKLDSELMEQVKKKYPYLLEKPEE